MTAVVGLWAKVLCHSLWRRGHAGDPMEVTPVADRGRTCDVPSLPLTGHEMRGGRGGVSFFRPPPVRGRQL